MGYSTKGGIYNIKGHPLVCEVIDKTKPIPAGYSLKKYDEGSGEGPDYNWSPFTVLLDANGNLVSDTSNKNIRPVHRGDDMRGWFFITTDKPAENIIPHVDSSEELGELFNFCDFPLLTEYDGNYVWVVLPKYGSSILRDETNNRVDDPF